MIENQIHPYDVMFNALLNGEDISLQAKMALLGAIHDTQNKNDRIAPESEDSCNEIMNILNEALSIKPEVAKKTVHKWLKDAETHLKTLWINSPRGD